MTRRSQKSFMAFSLLLLLFLSVSFQVATSLPYAFAVQTSQTNLGPTDNAYVVADLYDTYDVYGLRMLNTDNFTFLKVWYAWNVTQENVTIAGTEKIVSLAYLKFDLGALNAKNITSAELQLYANKTDLTGASREIIAYFVQNNTWSERTLTFDNAPAFDNAINASTAVSSANQWYTFDLTQMAQMQSKGQLTVVLAFALLYVHNEEQVIFNSKEALSNQPKLVVNYVPSASSSSRGNGILAFFSSFLGIFLISAAAIVAAGLSGFYVFRRSSSRGRGARRPPPKIMKTPTEETEVAAMASAAGTSSSLTPSQTQMERPVSGALGVCPNCGKPAEADFAVCAYCGFNLSRTKCPSCGRDLKKDYKLCPYCGKQL